MSYYTTGEKVIYTPTGDYATVLRDLPNDEYTVEFDNRSLIPPQMTVPGKTLSPQPVTLYGGYFPTEKSIRDSRFIDKNKFCPKCDVEWKETVGLWHSYYDCPKCKMKKEDA